jgi:hypothetical protein
MGRLISTMLGLGLIIFGIYLLSKNIIFTSGYYSWWFRGLAADISVLSLTAGVVGLFILGAKQKWVGWWLIALGIFCVFFSGSVVLRPTTAWQFIVSVVSFTAGYQLFTKGDIDI